MTMSGQASFHLVTSAAELSTRRVQFRSIDAQDGRSPPRAREILDTVPGAGVTADRHGGAASRPDGRRRRRPRAGCCGGARCRSGGHLQDEQDDSRRHLRPVRVEGDRPRVEGRRDGSGSLALRRAVRQDVGESRDEGRRSLSDLGRRLRDRGAGAERRERDRCCPHAAADAHPMRRRHLPGLRRIVRSRSHVLGAGERRSVTVVRVSRVGRDAVRRYGRLRVRRPDVWRGLSRRRGLLHAPDRRQHAECDVRLRPGRLDTVHQQRPADVRRRVSARARVRRRSARPVLVRLPVRGAEA
jgi:hypothetical protein